MSIVNKRLSKDALEAIEEFKGMVHGAGHVEVNAIEESRGGIWGAQFKFFDDTKELVAEETYLTVPGSTRRVAAFVTLYENGNAVDGEWQPIFMPEKSKTLSDFIVLLIDEDITPSILTMSAAGYEAESVCDCGDAGDSGDDEPYPCSACESESEEDCEDCDCADCSEECDDEKRSKCDGDPFDEGE